MATGAPAGDPPSIDELCKKVADHHEQMKEQHERMKELHKRLADKEVLTNSLLTKLSELGSKLDNTKKAQNTKVSKELAELKAALETHISTVVKKDEARLAEQHKLEGLLTSHRSDLDKKQAKLQAHENQLSVLSFREKDKQTKLDAEFQGVVEKKLKDLHQTIKTDFNEVLRPVKDLVTALEEKNDRICGDLDRFIRSGTVRDDNILSNLRKHEDQLSVFSFKLKALDAQLSELREKMDAKVDEPDFLTQKAEITSLCIQISDLRHAWRKLERI